MFRWLYFVVLVAGIFWIVSAQPFLTNQVGFIDSVMTDKSPPASDEKQIVLFPGEAGRRTMIVAIAVVAIVVSCEVWSYVRWRVLHRP